MSSDDDALPRVYWEMLAEYGVVSQAEIPKDPTPTPQTVRSLFYNPYQCCGEVVLDQPNGCFVCRGCGKIIESKLYLLDFYPYERGNSMNQPAGARNSMTIYRRRGYKPLTHFKEHLRRYMGGRFTEFPDGLLEDLQKEIDIADRNAYIAVRQVLKRKKLPKLYKEIFTMIYCLGGQKPELSNEQYHQCIRDFQWLMIRFFEERDQLQRHSMPSLYMLLDLILQKNHHEPYYHIPYLKDERLVKNVLYMYETLEKDELRDTML